MGYIILRYTWYKINFKLNFQKSIKVVLKLSEMDVSWQEDKEYKVIEKVRAMISLN